MTTEEEKKQLEIEIPALQQQIDAKRQRYTYLVKLEAGLISSVAETQRIQREFEESERRREEVWQQSLEATRQEGEESRQRDAERAERVKQQRQQYFDNLEASRRQQV